jgi:hypothetical protein
LMRNEEGACLLGAKDGARIGRERRFHSDTLSGSILERDDSAG